MKYVRQIETRETLTEMSRRSGIPRHLFYSKLTRLGINTDGYVSMDNQEYLQSVKIVENNQTYHLVPSKMNFDNV